MLLPLQTTKYESVATIPNASVVLEMASHTSMWQVAPDAQWLPKHP